MNIMQICMNAKAVGCYPDRAVKRAIRLLRHSTTSAYGPAIRPPHDLSVIVDTDIKYFMNLKGIV